MTCTVPELRRSQQSGQVLYGERQKRKKETALRSGLMRWLSHKKWREGKKQQVKKEGGTREGKGGKEKTVWGEVALKKRG